MTQLRSLLAQLRGCLAACLLALCLGGAAVIASLQFAQNAQQQRQEARQRLDAARALLATATEDSNNLHAYTQEYRRLLERNVIGEERRLEWLERMEELRRQRRVENFSYAIAPQRVTQDGDEKLELRQSGMRLQFDLLHEGQLLDFLDALHATQRGWFLPAHCALERGTATPLRAECTGSWLTMRLRSRT